MSESDSEFSDYEEEYSNVNESGLYLGYAESTPLVNQDEVTFEDNHLGGQPVWLDPDSSPDDSFIKCKACSSIMLLLLQIYAPIVGSYYDRALYVFCCKSASCRRKEGSIRALRSVKRDEKREEEERLREQREFEEEKAKTEAESRKKTETVGILGSQLFGGQTASSNPFASGAVNPFSTSGVKNEVGNAGIEDSKPQSTQIRSNIKKPVEMKKSKKVLPEYPCYLINDIEIEELSPDKRDPILDRVSTDVLDNDIEEDTNEAKINNKDMEKVIDSISTDKTFQKFVDRIAHNPEQVLRYNADGLVPLLYTSNDDIAQKLSRYPLDIPLCHISNTPRVIELQIMPYAIMVLEKHGDIFNGMEWGTIFVATPKEDSMPKLDAHGVGYAEEWVGVQWEET